MSISGEPVAQRDVDAIQQRLTSYACDLNYEALSAEAIHEAKVRVIDTLGALIAGFHGESARIARNLAAQMPNTTGATVIGTRMKTAPDMAAFANAIAARSAEMMDVYHYPGSFGGHPSDVIMPAFAAAEHKQSSGRDLILGVVLAYEVFLRLSDVFHNPGFDDTNFSCIASAITAAKLWGLSSAQVANCIAMAIVPNVILKQVRTDRLTAWKVIATGHAGRAGLFAAMLAREEMEGPHLPFVGKAGWCDHVARERFALDVMGGGTIPYKILDTRIKHRPAAGETISSIIAAEKVAPAVKNIKDIKQVTVELYKRAIERAGSGEHHWSPRSRDAAGNSIPYVTAVTLMDGTVTLRSFNDAHLANPEARALMHKVKLVENAEFTKAYQRLPVEHRTRITVVTNKGEQFVGESGGDEDDLSARKSDAQIEAKFHRLTDECLSAKRAGAILASLWELEKLPNVAAVPSELVII